jgi:hypothetical protein
MLAVAAGEALVATLGEGEAEGADEAEGAGEAEDPELAEVVGVAEAAMAEALGPAVVAGLAETATFAEAWGEPAAVGEVAILGAGKAPALRTSFSRTPTRRSMLCLAVSTVRSKVRPKKMHPRYTVAFVRTVAV